MAVARVERLFAGEKAVSVQRDFFSDCAAVRGQFNSCRFMPLTTRQDAQNILERLRAGAVQRLLISNPYRDDTVRGLYDVVRAESLPFVIVERGAVPGSIFFDTTGFLRDSALYDARHWDKPLDEMERQRLGARMTALSSDGAALEIQPHRTDPVALRNRLTGNAERLCAVLLQTSNDTVVRRFVASGFTYAHMLDAIGRAVAAPPPGWKIVVKAHPKEPVAALGGFDTVQGVHVDDLVAAADAVVTFNSGSGLLAMMAGKPVGCFGDAWYAGPGLAARLGSNADLGTFLSQPETFADATTRERFLHHVLCRVLSEVTFLGATPWSPPQRTVAMTPLRLRRFDPVTGQTLERPYPAGGFAAAIRREGERLRAWRRTALNRLGAG